MHGAAACAGCLLFPSVLRAADEGLPDAAHSTQAAFFENLSGTTVRCGNCPRQCIILNGRRGHCGTRQNLDGVLYSLSYGNPCTAHVDPIEKKPLLHFFPGTTAFSLAVAGCTLHCLNCQNWEISQTTPDKTRNYDLPPFAVVSSARKYGCASIACTYSEATTFYEYMSDIAALGKKDALHTVWVSNAYIRSEPLARLCTLIDAACLNLKAFDDDTYKTLCDGTLAPVLSTLKTVHQSGVWLEIINLVVPTYTDKMDMIRRMCGWILQNLGELQPLTFSRFFPRYRLTTLPPTPLDVLRKARQVAHEEGLKYVYLGNVPEEQNDLVCYSCKKTVVSRQGYRILENRLVQGACPFCGTKIPGRFA
ncbi:MAG: AmmeMemoRadiSam system radical SAM enzyme [Thermodesulfobacteriota bacterium]